MSKSFYYQQSKKLIDYFNKKNINIRTRQQLKPNEFNTVKKKYVSKGSNINFWKKHTEKLQKIKKQVRISTKLKQQITAFKFVKKFTGQFLVQISFDVSKTRDAVRTRKFTVSTPATIDEIFEMGREVANDRWGHVFTEDDFIGEIEVYKVSVTGPNIPIGKMQINDVKFFKIKNIGSANDAKIKDNCVKYAFDKFYGNAKYYTKKARKVIESTQQHTVDSLIKFMKDYKLDYRFFYKNGEIYDQNMTNGNKVIHGYLANEHFYLMDGKDCDFLRTHNDVKIDKIEICNNVQELVENAIEQGEIIEHFNIKCDEITKQHMFSECVIENKKYTNNALLCDAFNMYKKILSDEIDVTEFLFDEKFKIYTPLMKIAECNNLKSTFTDFMDNPKPLFYNTQTKGDYCIDKNKAYTWSLCTLVNLPVINASTPEEPFDGIINNEYFYYIKDVHDNEYGRYVHGWCSGYRIENIKNVTITKQIKPKLIKNPYTGIINKMIEYNPTLTKEICNMFYGVCQTKKMNNLVPVDIIKTTHGYDNDTLIKCGKYYVVMKEITQKTKFCEDMKPVAHFIVDRLINEIFNTIKKLDITKIIKLKTDSITYNGDIPMFKLNPDDFNGWKMEEVKIDKFTVKDTKTEPKIIKEIGRHIDLYQNVLFNCSAGSGKTYCAINELIPKLKGKTVVLSATCKALEEYYELDNNNIDVRTIQFFMHGDKMDIKEKYARKRLFRSYDNIIAEEFGLFDDYMCEYLYKNIGKTQLFYAFGDHDQLKPVMGEVIPLKNNIIVNTFFDCYHVLNENWRNNFTVDEYENMKNLNYEIHERVKPLINRISKTNICYTNDTKEKINCSITDKWVETFGQRIKLTSKGKRETVDMKIKKGGRIICVNNKLKVLDIYNSQRFIVIDFNDEKIKIKNISSKKEYTLTKWAFNKNFDYGYALTLYKIQGESVNINQLGIFDLYIIGNDGKKLYTCLSRIKEDLINKPKPYGISFYYKEQFKFESVKMVNKLTRKKSIDFDDWLNNHTFGK